MSDEVLIRCPVCGDHPTHAHCYVNTQKGVWQCHYCGRSGSVKSLTREFPGLSEIVSLLKLSAETASHGVPSPRLLATLPVLLPEASWGADYLRQRGLTTGELARFRVCVSPALPNRVIFPEYVGYDISFWSARTVRKEHPKWLFPKNSETWMRKSESVWGLDLIQKNSEIWIAEGVLDAIAVKGVCVYGKIPSNTQLRLILSKEPSEVVIALDRDAPDEAERLRQRLKGIVKTDIQVPRVKDYGLYLQAGYRRIKGTKEFRKEIVQ